MPVGRCDQGGALFTYAYRGGSVARADNRALRAALELQTPLVYFRALEPGQYRVVAPMFVTTDEPAARVVVLEPGLPVQDMQPGGLISGPDVRAYATRGARCRLHQPRFKRARAIDRVRKRMDRFQPGETAPTLDEQIATVREALDEPWGGPQAATVS